MFSTSLWEFISENFLTPGTEFDLRVTWDSCEILPDSHFTTRVRELTRSKSFSGIAEITVEVGSGANVSRNRFFFKFHL